MSERLTERELAKVEAAIEDDLRPIQGGIAWLNWANQDRLDDTIRELVDFVPRLLAEVREHREEEKTEEYAYFKARKAVTEFFKEGDK